MNSDNGVKKGVAYWQNELEEWEKFLRQCVLELSTSEVLSVMRNIEKIEKIIYGYKNPPCLFEQNKKAKLERAFARQTLIYGR